MQGSGCHQHLNPASAAKVQERNAVGALLNRFHSRKQPLYYAPCYLLMGSLTALHVQTDPQDFSAALKRMPGTLPAQVLPGDVPM